MLHRDMKPENILVDNALESRLCDFGLSCYEKKVTLS